jgi:hypothetical protein
MLSIINFNNYSFLNLEIISKIQIKYFINLNLYQIFMGIGDWGLGIGDWGLGPIPNPQSPIPNPQSPIPMNICFIKS